MTLNNLAAKSTATIALGLVGCAVASAQSGRGGYHLLDPNVSLSPSIGTEMGNPRLDIGSRSETMTFRRRDRDTWNTLLWISAAVAIVGLANDDAGLMLIGGIGVVYSLSQNNQLGLRYGPTHQGLDLVSTGPLSFGLAPTYYRVGETREVTYQSPCLQLRFKF